jgi:hypothetical protein
MSRPNLRTRLRVAAQGLKARASASPDIWDESGSNGRDWPHQVDDVSAWLELPGDFSAPDGETND